MLQSAVARLEAGARIPRIDTLERLLRACGRTLVTEPRWAAGVASGGDPRPANRRSSVPSARTSCSTGALRRPGGGGRGRRGLTPLLGLLHRRHHVDDPVALVE